MISPSKIRTMFFQLLRIRMVEERIALEYPKGEIRCPTHLSIGQEAIAVGVCASLKKTDYVMSTHRAHAHYLAKGGNLDTLIAELYGKETGCAKGWGGSQHLIDQSVGFLGSVPIVGATIPMIVGSALVSTLMADGAVSVAFFGDGAVEEGVFAESVNFAVLKKLPVLFVCENNLYATVTPIRERQPDRPIVNLARSQRIASYQIDGNNLLAVYETAKKLVRHLALGYGPAFLECLTYRQYEHCGPSFDYGNARPESEYRTWLGKDPVVRMTNYVLKKHMLSKNQIDRMKRTITDEIDRACTFAIRSPIANISDFSHMVYA